MTPDWTAISTGVTQIIEVLHLGDEPLACTALDHCQRRAAGPLRRWHLPRRPVPTLDQKHGSGTSRLQPGAGSGGEF
jgi:hypothetical protein